MKNNFLTLIAAVAAVILCCSSEGNLTGGGSDTEVSSRKVAGAVVDSMGVPVCGASVVLRPLNYVSDSLADTTYLSRRTLLETVSLPDGSFLFDSLIADTYCISSVYMDSIAALVHFIIDLADTALELPPDTMQRMAVVDGNVKVYGTDSSNCYLQLFGTEFRKQPDESGYFSMKVPRGKHTLHISAFEKNDTLRNEPMDDMDVTFEIKDQYKHFGSFRLEPPPEFQCKDFTCDSIIMRNALDAMNLTNVDVREVCTVENNRIIGISLRNRSIGQLSGEVRNLTELRELDLGHTGIKTVMPDIGTLRKLTSLKLDSNNLMFLPSSICDLNELSCLDIKMNIINDLPSSISALTPDALLDLSGNRLCDLDSVESSWASQYDPDWKMLQNCK